MKGTQIIVQGPPLFGIRDEGIIGDTSKPGTIMQVKAGVLPVGGRFTWIAANSGTDGKAVLLAVLLEDSYQGKTFADAYVSGTRGFLYTPARGEDMNLRLGEVAGTGNTYAIGDRLIVDAEDGLLVPESGSPQQTAAICLETLTQQAGSTLAWCKAI